MALLKILTVLFIVSVYATIAMAFVEFAVWVWTR
jgi:hypothetical protein